MSSLTKLFKWQYGRLLKAWIPTGVKTTQRYRWRGRFRSPFNHIVGEISLRDCMFAICSWTSPIYGSIAMPDVLPKVATRPEADRCRGTHGLIDIAYRVTCLLRTCHASRLHVIQATLRARYNFGITVRHAVWRDQIRPGDGNDALQAMSRMEFNAYERERWNQQKKKGNKNVKFHLWFIGICINEEDREEIRKDARVPPTRKRFEPRLRLSPFSSSTRMLIILTYVLFLLFHFFSTDTLWTRSSWRSEISCRYTLIFFLPMIEQQTKDIFRRVCLDTNRSRLIVEGGDCKINTGTLDISAYDWRIYGVYTHCEYGNENRAGRNPGTISKSIL